MAPIFTKQLTNQENLVEGSHVYIEAQVEPRADPNLRIEWYKNGKALTTGGYHTTKFFLYCIAAVIIYFNRFLWNDSNQNRLSFFKKKFFKIPINLVLYYGYFTLISFNVIYVV